MRRRCLFIAGTLAACFAAIALARAQTAPSIPLNVNTGIKEGFNVVISAGGGPARPVLFDSGSAGLWIYPDAIGTYTTTPYDVRQSYPSGITYEGTVVYTTIDFGNGLKTASIPVALVREAACSDERPHCAAEPGSRGCPSVRPGPGAGIACLEASRKLYGHFGAAPWTIGIPRGSPQPKIELYNILLGIPQPWASAYVVTPTQIVFGVPTTGFTLVPMQRAIPLPEPIPSGAFGWTRSVTICYTLGTSLSNKCFPSIFDTGAANIVMQNVDLPLAPGACGQQVPAGMPLEARLPDGTVLGRFTTGDTPNRDIVRTGNSSLQTWPGGFVNTGFTFFNYDDVLFDMKNGYIGLRPRATPSSSAQACGGG
jgi:hypothetical protein